MLNYSHYLDTPEGVRVVCFCSTGKDHDEDHFDCPEDDGGE